MTSAANGPATEATTGQDAVATSFAAAMGDDDRTGQTARLSELYEQIATLEGTHA